MGIGDASICQSLCITDTTTSQRDTSSNALKRSHGLKADCYVVHHTNKEKSIILPFKEGPTPRIDDLFFEKYPVPKLETSSEEILFRSHWNLIVNDRSIDPMVCAKMLDHMVLPQDIMFAS